MFLSTFLASGLFWVLAAAAAADQGHQNKYSQHQRLQPHGKDFIPDHVLRVSYQNISIACETRWSVVVNGTSPGPAIRLKAGQPSWIRVYNDMTDKNTTMHWHGLSQRMAAFSDGTPSVSQWPIAPLEFFDYEIRPEEHDAGTYFYHSHVGFQSVSSHGPLIVEDCEEPPYKYDEERVVQFGDYFNATDSSIVEGLLAQPFVWTGETHAVLINGVGVSIDSVAGVSGCEMPVIHVEAGKTYRLRFIGGTAISMVQFGIADHGNFTIIAADGQYTQPHSERYMQVSSGQRFDVLFTAKCAEELGNQTDYVMQFETKDRPSIYHGYGVLRYSNATPEITKAPLSPPLTFSNATYAWAEYAFQPLKPNDCPKASEVTRRIELRNRQLTAVNGSIVWQIDGLAWNDTSNSGTPYLVNIYENGPAAIPDYDTALANYGWDRKTRTWPARIGEVLEIVIYNQPSHVGKQSLGLDYHPWHGHGRHYCDMGSGNGTYDPAANEVKLQNYNPVLRDTTNLYRYSSRQTVDSLAGWRVWRVRVDDAGVWMIHCHILQHMIMGMQSIWVMGDYEQIASIPHYDAAGYLEYGGSAYGNDSWTPSYVHNFG